MRLASLGFLVGFLLAPVAAAWPDAQLGGAPAASLLARWSEPPSLPAHACVVGDANGDGFVDLLVATRDARAGELRVSLLAGPSYQNAIWSRALRADATIGCAPDAQRDGVADPLARVDGLVESMSGATGESLFQVRDAPSERAVSVFGILSVFGASDARVVPAGADLFLHVVTRSGGLAADVSVVSAEVRVSDVRVELLDAAGVRRALLDASTPGASIVQAASVRAGADLRVLVLSRAPQGAVTVSAYSPSGALLWSHELDARVGVTLLSPRFADVDHDGAPDVAVESFDPAGHSGLDVLSGNDGSVLATRPPSDGSTIAVPFGPDASGNDSALLVHQDPGARDITVTPVGEGAPAWTAPLPADAAPINVVRDPYSSDATGFSDLTGDGMPDLAVRSDPERVEVIDGATGRPVWSAPVPSDASVFPVPAAGGGDDLLVYDPAPSPDGGSFDLTRLDGATGTPLWSSSGALPAGSGAPNVQPLPPKDDRVAPDLLFTIPPGPEGAGAGSASNGTGAVYVVDGGGGGSRWTAPLDSQTPDPPRLESTNRPGARTAAISDLAPVHPPRWLVMGAIATAAASLIVGALALRRMK